MTFSEQFLHSPDYPYNVVLEGRLNVWYRPQWLGPLFWVLGKIGILLAESGEMIPTKLVVRAKYEENHQPVHFWDRTFQFKTVRHFNTILRYDDTWNDVGDFVGAGRMVYLVWKARYHPPKRFTLDSQAAALYIGHRFFWLPEWLWQWLLGVVRCVQEADNLTAETFRLDLVIWHPWFGDFFGYNGRLRTYRTPKEDL